MTHRNRPEKANRQPPGQRQRKTGRTPHRTSAESGLRLYGRHAVMAALANPLRHKHCLYGERKALEHLTRQRALPHGLTVSPCDPATLAALVPPQAITQGLVLDVSPLPARTLDDFAPRPEGRSLILVLDQVEDPHNVGAILRSAALFGALCIITQDRHAPPESGALARAASGALDVIPWVKVTNIAAALDQLARMGYWRIGLAGEGSARLDNLDMGDALVLVLGAEGRGLRPLTKKHCDILAHIPIADTGGLIDSFNVSNAAAIALYALGQRRT